MDEKRCLVFDSACVACSKTARLIEDESHGWLTARSLGDEEVRRLLAAAGRPDLWAPSIIESSGGKVRVLTGSRMVLRLVLGIGPVHARRTLRAIRSALHEPAAAPVEPAAAGRQVSRRQVLEWSGGALGALMLGPRALRQLSHPVTRPSAGVAASHITVGDAEQLKQLAGVQAASARFGR